MVYGLTCLIMNWLIIMFIIGYLKFEGVTVIIVVDPIYSTYTYTFILSLNIYIYRGLQSIHIHIHSSNLLYIYIYIYKMKNILLAHIIKHKLKNKNRGLQNEAQTKNTLNRFEALI